jgi:phage terminase Nu1 subunit (DNA packaging protein)
VRLVSQPDLVELTGKTWRTVTKRLKDAGVVPRKRVANAELFASDKALAVIYGVVDQASELERNHARLAAARADRMEQDLALRAGELLDADVALAWIEDMAVTVKSRLAQIPDAVANEIDVRYSATVAAAVRKLIDQALTELSRHSRRPSGPGKHRSRGSNGEDANRRRRV